MRILSDRDVERLIVPADAIATIAEGYRRHSSVRMPAPRRIWAGKSRRALVLTGHSDGPTFALKANKHVYPEPHAHHREAAGMMLPLDAVRCAPTALLATTLFNGHHAAARLAAAVAALARPDVRTITVFGAGKIAPAVVRCLALARPFERVLIFGRGPEPAQALAASLHGASGLDGVEISVIADAVAATHSADVIVTITSSETAVFPGREVRAGALVVLAGPNRPHAREADDGLICRAQIYVDHCDGCKARAGDLFIALGTGALRAGQIAAELGSLSSTLPPVIGPLDVTVFKSIGVIAQDIVLAEVIVERAEQMGIGIEFDPASGGAEGPPHQKPSAPLLAECLP
jgi:ornithine cyclodeaminase/alanine dehydrogenase-like protein (mu-crystallin family)